MIIDIPDIRISKALRNLSFFISEMEENEKWTDKLIKALKKLVEEQKSVIETQEKFIQELKIEKEELWLNIIHQMKEECQAK